jgi:hypothetical protein
MSQLYGQPPDENGGRSQFYEAVDARGCEGEAASRNAGANRYNGLHRHPSEGEVLKPKRLLHHRGPLSVAEDRLAKLILGNPISMPMLTAADCFPFLGFTLQVGSINQPRFLVGQNIQSSATSTLHESPCSRPLTVREKDGPRPTMNSAVEEGETAF